MLSAGSANAQLLYSYETISGPGPDGFFGLGATVTQDTIGATDGTKSMKYAVAPAPTFVGARTETVIAPGLGPPVPPAVQFDLRINSPNEEYNGAGACRIGITFFGHDLDNAVFGVQVQTNGASEQNIDLATGNYTLTIPLVATDGLTFAQHFDNSPTTDLDVVSAFQFYINKGSDSGVTVYIDNVRAVPEPVSIAGAGALAGLMLRRRRA
jgi:hypothetical protein